MYNGCMKYESLFKTVLTDIDSVLEVINKWDAEFKNANDVYKMNIYGLTAKLIDYICVRLDYDCKHGLHDFITDIDNAE